MRLSPVSTITMATLAALLLVSLTLTSAPVQVDAAAAAARATKERRSSPAKIPASDSEPESTESKPETNQYDSQQIDFRTAPAPTKQKLDPSDPQFQEAVHRHILTKLEDIVAGLQRTQEALRGLQNIAIADNDPQLQTTIAQALTKVERALYGTASSIGNQKNGGTSTGMYSHLPPENWMAVSITILANHTTCRTCPLARTTA